MRNAHVAVLSALSLGACSSPGGPFPSLQPRAVEAVDPRLPVEAPVNSRPVDPGLASRLAALVAQAQSGDAAFAPLASRAEALAAGIAGPNGEAWVSAQEALSAAVAARAPTARALGEADALAAEALARQGGIAPSDFAAIRDAAAEIAAIDARQAGRVDAIQRRLGN